MWEPSSNDFSNYIGRPVHIYYIDSYISKDKRKLQKGTLTNVMKNIQGVHSVIYQCINSNVWGSITSTLIKRVEVECKSEVDDAIAQFCEKYLVPDMKQEISKFIVYPYICI